MSRGLGVMFGELPPLVPFMWAALGRLSLPALPDTVIRVSGDTVQADIGHPIQWRLTVVRDQLTQLQRISGGRIVESVERNPGKEVRYESSDHRSLHLRLKSEQPTTFDASIWHY